MNKLLIAITALIVIAAGLYFTVFNQQEQPEYRYTSIAGQQGSSEQLKGKVVLVKFWATNCTTCIAQMPDTVSYYEKYKDQGYDTLAVAMSYDKADAIQKFSDTFPLPFTVIHDKSNELSKEFGDIRFTPIAFLIDRQGNIVKRYIGKYDKTEFIQTLEKTLAQK